MRFLSAFVALSFWGGCYGDPPLPPTVTDGPSLTPLGASAEAVFLDQPVLYCRERAVQPTATSVQVLVDASGSMAGFQRVVPLLSQWTKQAVSRLDGDVLLLDGFRLAQFSAGRGVFAATGWTGAPAVFTPSQDTNLHEAIRTATDYDLTILLTDGVAAAGVGGSGDCPGGVDASCVARALRAFVHSGDRAERSIHLLPLVAPYDGRFYSEEILSPQDFDAAATAETVERDVGSAVSVVNPVADPNGRLAYTYRGPRALLAIILAATPEVGRAAADALVTSAGSNGIRRGRGLGDGASGVAHLTPAEVYPGGVGPVTWASLTTVDDPGLQRGTMDLSLGEGGREAGVIVGCSGAEIASKDAVLLGDGRTPSGCLALDALPAARFALTAADADEDALESALGGYGADATARPDSLYLRATCPARLPAGGARAYWNVQLDYALAADCIVGAECDHAPFARVRALSTERPSGEPHRVFNLSALLGSFFDLVSDDRRSARLATVRFETTP